MEPQQIGTLACACISLLLLLIALCSNNWLENSFSHTGLWKSCVNVGMVYKCVAHGMNVKDYYHATRTFMFLGMFAGAVSCIGLSGPIFGLQLGSLSKAKTAAIASLLAALFVMIAMAVFTGETGGKASYGWSFCVAWATFPLFLITGGLAFCLNAA
ncbi:lens fiber membrane intrinsic protein-like [Zootoca vivipara]|uniref:lens fiber membrane intrinsic protein-like n=1 Tax=Zootoca vivipara TaxID=8524 RepID=UPI001591B576|nr:lens fiber membrane intrinsic protein-like [Zootoca vivipara]